MAIQRNISIWVRFLPAEGESLEDVPQEEIRMTRVSTFDELKEPDQFFVNDTGIIQFAPSKRPRKFNTVYSA